MFIKKSTVVLRSALLCFLLLSASSVQAGHREDQARLLDDVLRMTYEGVPEDLIILQIKAMDFEFELVADDIIELRSLGVSDAVLEALIETALIDDEEREYRRRTYVRISLGYYSPWYRYPSAWGCYYDPFPAYWSWHYYPFYYGSYRGYYGYCSWNYYAFYYDYNYPYRDRYYPGRRHRPHRNNDPAVRVARDHGSRVVHRPGFTGTGAVTPRGGVSNPPRLRGGTVAPATMPDTAPGDARRVPGIRVVPSGETVQPGSMGSGSPTVSDRRPGRRVPDGVGTVTPSSRPATTPSRVHPAPGNTVAPERMPANSEASASRRIPTRDKSPSVRPATPPKKDVRRPARQVRPSSDVKTTPKVVVPKKRKTPPKVKPAPRRTTPKVKPAPRRSAPKIKPAPRRSAPKVKPAPRRSAPKIKPAPRRSAPKVKPAPRRSAPKIKPAPRRSAPKIKPAPRRSAPKVKPAPRRSAPKARPVKRNR